MGKNLDHMGCNVQFSSYAWFGLDILLKYLVQYDVQFGIYVRSSAWFRINIQFKCFFRLECSFCYNVWISLKIQFGLKMLCFVQMYNSVRIYGLV